MGKLFTTVCLIFGLLGVVIPVFSSLECSTRAMTEKLITQYNTSLDELQLYPFLPLLFADKEKLEEFCRLEERIRIQCGEIDEWRNSAQFYICENKDQMLSNSQCFVEMATNTESCVQACFSAELCSAFKCVVKCTKSSDLPCKGWVNHYYGVQAKALMNNSTIFTKDCTNLIKYAYFMSHRKGICTTVNGLEVKQARNDAISEKHSCNCLDQLNRLNAACISNCYLPCVQPGYVSVEYDIHGNSTVTCNVTLCKEEIRSYLFKQLAYGSWFDVTLNRSDAVIVNMSDFGISEFSLHCGASFRVGITLHKTVDFEYCTEFQFDDYLPHKNYDIDIENMERQGVYLTRQNRLVKLRKAGKMFGDSFLTAEDFRDFDQTPKMHMGMRVLIGNHIKQDLKYAPPALKTVPSNLKPEAPKELELYSTTYSAHFIKVELIWTCPRRWHGIPLSYDIDCSIELHDVNSTHCKNNAPFRKASKWTEQSLKMFENTIDWKDNEVIFWLENWSIPLNGNSFSLVCRIRAINVNGAGPWSASVQSPFQTEIPGDPCYHPIEVLQSGSSYDSNPAYTKLVWRRKLSGKRYGNLFFERAPRNAPVSADFGQTAKEIQTDYPMLFGAAHNETKQLTHHSIGCYDWLADEWIVAVRRVADNNSTWIGITTGLLRPQGTHQYQYLQRTESEPYNILCYPASSTVVWSEVGESVKIFVMESNRTTHSITPSDYKCCPQLAQSRIISGSITRGYVTASYIVREVERGENGLNTYTYKTRPDRTVIVQTNTGLWKIWFDYCKCTQLVQSDARLGPVTTMTVLGLDKVTVIVNSSAEFLERTRGQQQAAYFIDGTKGTIRLQGNINLFCHKTTPNDLNSASIVGYPSVICNRDDRFEYKYSPKLLYSLSEYQHYLPHECFFPNTTLISYEAKDRNTAVLTIQLQWSEQSECEKISKPPVIYSIKYRPIGVRDKEGKCTGRDCACSEEDCRTWSSGISRDQVSTKAILVDLEADHEFYIETSAETELGQFRKLWYGVANTETQSSERKIPQIWSSRSSFSSHYVEPNTRLRIILLSVFIPFGIVIIIFATLLVYMYKRRWYIYQHIQRITANQIQKTVKLGEGYFGEVYLATLTYSGRYCLGLYVPLKSRSEERKVAVKLLKQSAGERDKRSFLEEAILISKLRHVNIVKTVAICMDSRPLMLALELVNGGSLESLLHDSKVQKDYTASDLLKMAIQITNGCLYLEQSGILHRDLSAKNCLVQIKSNGKPDIVKISDFGLAKETHSMSDRIYRTDVEEALPTPFMAPECFGETGSFTVKSEVWAYGVVLWQIFSWSATPFLCCGIHRDEQMQQCPWHNPNMLSISKMVVVFKKTLKDLGKPCYAIFPNCIMDLMEQCWSYDAEKRPSFRSIQQDLVSFRNIMTMVQLERPIRNECETVKTTLTSENSEVGSMPRNPVQPLEQLQRVDPSYSLSCDIHNNSIATEASEPSMFHKASDLTVFSGYGYGISSELNPHPVSMTPSYDSGISVGYSRPLLCK